MQWNKNFEGKSITIMSTFMTLTLTIHGSFHILSLVVRWVLNMIYLSS